MIFLPKKTNTPKKTSVSVQHEEPQQPVAHQEPRTRESQAQPVEPKRPESSQTKQSGSKLSGGAIAGIVIGCVAFLALVGGLTYWLYNKKNLDETTTQV